MKRWALPAAALVPALIGLGIFLYKWLGLGFPPLPETATRVWSVQARFTIDADTGPVRAILQIPSSPNGYTILDEHFISKGYGLSIQEDGGSREAWWSKRDAAGRQTLYYRVEVAPGGAGRPESADSRLSRPEPPSLEEPFQTALTSLVDEVRSRSADASSFAAELLNRLNESPLDEKVELLLGGTDSVTARSELAVEALSAAGISARIAYGIRLVESRRYASFEPWLEVWSGRRWLGFDPESGEEGLPPDLLIWWRGERPLIWVLGASNPEVEMSVRAAFAEALEVAQRRAGADGSRLLEFSLLNLPLQIQAVYSVVLLIPIGAFLVVLLRNVVGFRTFGTFMPVLIALAFRETRFLWGVVLFALVMTIGLSLRFVLDRLRLLLVPRLAVVLNLVVLVLVVISVLSYRLDLEAGLSVALFPIVILSMAIERMSVLWEERGAQEAIIEGLGTFLVAALAYAVLNLDIIEYYVVVYPELLLVLLAATLLLGRYSGYRLSELIRFRSLGGG